MSCYRQKRDIAWRNFAGEAVLLDPSEGVVFVLNEVGLRIWSLLDEPQPPAELARQICEEYSVPPEQVTGDVTAFLEALQERGLVEVA